MKFVGVNSSKRYMQTLAGRADNEPSTCDADLCACARCALYM